MIAAERGRQGHCRRCRPWSPTSGRAATSASISSTRSRARRKAVAGIEAHHGPFLHGALDHQSAIAARGRGDAAGGAVRATSAAPAACSSGRPRPTSPRPSQRIEAEQKAPATSGRPGSRRSRMRGCRSTTCTGRRRWWSRSRRQEGRELGASGLPTAASCRSRSTTPRRSASSRSTTWFCVRVERGARARAARAPSCGVRPDGAGHGGGAGEQDRPHPRHGRRLLLSAEPAQPRDPGAAPARLRDQAAEPISRRWQAACSPTRW